MNKLIKLSETHYIIVDDSEKKIGDWIIDIKNVKFPRQIKTNHLLEDLYESEKKITHTNGRLEGVKHISLSEIQEVIYGYSVDKLFEEEAKSWSFGEHGTSNARKWFSEGFKAHQELVKDKLFTVEDMKKMFAYGYHAHNTSENLVDYVNKFINSLLPKTEWDIEFNEQGKIKLI